MTTYQSNILELFLLFLISSIDRATDNIVFFVCIFQLLPNHIFCKVLIFKIKGFSWSTSKISECNLGISSFNSFITSMNFSKCFLSNDDPHFSSVCPRKSKRSISCWNIIVNNDKLSHSIFAHNHSVHTNFVSLRMSKHLLNSLWELSKCG